jgi:hypothetical protein
MVLRALLFITSLLVAGCAAWFSVLGIATLFSGSYVSVLIMASALEIGKLVATTYLHHYWTHTSALLKGYLVTATLILMCITSLGIFGYLSSAYAVNSIQFSKLESTSQQSRTLCGMRVGMWGLGRVCRGRGLM